MIRNNISWTIKNLKAMVDNPNKDTLNFSLPIQRKSGVWSNQSASLLIHSIVMNNIYPIPAIYCLKELNGNGKYVYSILDGKQRLTEIFRYINNEYPLVDVPKAIVDGDEYDLDGLYYDDLPQEIQLEISKYRFLMYSFEPEEDEDEEFVNALIEDIFFRLNSSVALSITDKSRALMGVSAINFLNTILQSKLFAECSKFSSNQLKKSDDLNCLLQACMLLEHKYNGYEFKNLSQKETSLYAEYLHDNLSFEMKQRLTNICTYLEKAFPAGNEKQLKKINIPIVFLVADEAIGEDYDSSNKKSTYRVGPRYFNTWFHKFFDENYEEYSQYCSSGSTRLDKTQGRIDCMLNNFKEYFEIETKEIQVEEHTQETAIDATNIQEETVAISRQENEEESQTTPLPTNEEAIVMGVPIDINNDGETTTAINDDTIVDNDNVDNEETSPTNADDEQNVSFTDGIIADMEDHPLEEESSLLEDSQQ
jgi:hypothetical protein